MATAQALITRALRLIGAVGAGEAPTSVELADGLESLNAMLDSWQLDRLSIYAYQDLSATITGDRVLLGGTSGDIPLRPLRIENLYARLQGVDIGIDQVDQVRWYGIPDKGLVGDAPRLAYYEPSMEQGVLHLFPAVNQCEIHVVMWVPLSTFADLTTDVLLPPGYGRALGYNLAVELSAEYEAQPSPAVQQIASDSLASVKRGNQRPITSYVDIGMRAAFDTHSGDVV